ALLEEAEPYDGEKRVAVFPGKVIKSLLLNSDGDLQRVVHGNFAQTVIQDTPQALCIGHHNLICYIVVSMKALTLRPGASARDGRPGTRRYPTDRASAGPSR